MGGEAISADKRHKAGAIIWEGKPEVGSEKQGKEDIERQTVRDSRWLGLDMVPQRGSIYGKSLLAWCMTYTKITLGANDSGLVLPVRLEEQ